jgi:photosystem II stability/assembly factor-like uncharacterized protein
MRPMQFIGLYLMLLISIPTNTISAQVPEEDTKATLKLRHLVVAKNGQMQAVQSGCLFKTDSFGGDWTRKTENLGVSTGKYGSQDINDYSFFNSDTFLLSGYMHDSSGGNAFILRTTTGGKDFQKIYFPNTKSNCYMDAAFCNKKGQAWLAQADSGFFFSADYGLNWQKVGRFPKDANWGIRASTIFFKDEQTGIIAAHRSILYLTNDNCKTFRAIETPYNQKKLPQRSESPTINDVFLYSDWIIVNCSNRWFYTKVDKINWQVLETINGVFLDTETQQLWAFNKDNHIILLDNQLNTSWQSPAIYKNPPLSTTASNGDLYFFDEESLYKVNKTSSTNSLNYQKDTPIQVELEKRSKATYITWGWDDANLYQSRNLGKTWYRVEQLPNARDCRFNAVNDSILLIYDFAKMQRFEYNSQTKERKPYQLTHFFDDFLTAKITKVSISSGSQGCFHYEDNLIDYQWNKDKRRFQSSDIQTSVPRGDNEVGFTTKTKRYSHHFTQETLDSFMQRLNREPEKQLIWADFKMQKMDAEKYLKELKYFNLNEESWEQPKQKPIIDTAFLNAIANRNDFDEILLKNVFCQDTRYYSTTTTWTSLFIHNERGEKIELTSNDWNKSPYYITWTVKYKNWEFRTADIGIFKFMSPLSPKEFWREATNENWAVYMSIAKHLYRQRLGMD